MKKKFILLSVLFTIFISIFCYPNASKADIRDDIQMASIYIDNGNLNNAKYLADKVISEYKNYSDGYHLLASVYAHESHNSGSKEMCDKALASYQRAIDINNYKYVQKYDSHLQRAMIFWDFKKDKMSALKEYDNAINSLSDYSQKAGLVYSQRGELKTELNSPVGAQADLEKALTFDEIKNQEDLYVRTLAFLSKALYMQKKYDASIASALDALNISGFCRSYPSVTAQVYMAKSLYAKKEYEAAKSAASMAKFHIEEAQMTSDQYYKDMIYIINNSK